VAHIPDSKTEAGIADMPITELAREAFRRRIEATPDPPYLFPTWTPWASRPHLTSFARAWKITKRFTIPKLGALFVSARGGSLARFLHRYATMRPRKLALTTTFLVAVAVAQAAEESGGQPRKAAFLSEKEQQFIRPGLQLQILGALIGSDDRVEFRFRISDSKGAALDREGVLTPGAVTIRAVLGYIPQVGAPYVAYTVRTQTSPNGISAQQAGFDQGSVVPVGEGEYSFTFGEPLPVSFDASATHTVAAWANRDLEEFELGEFYDADTFDWVPDGSDVTVKRNIVDDSSCNQCHGELSAHDNRTKVAVCVTCHTPQSTDPDTGNSVDMGEMTHKIHMGSSLPSVRAGEPYQIVGFRQSVHDYSNVVYPADVRNCQTCHIQPDGAAAVAAPAATRAHRRSRVSSRSSAVAERQQIGANQHLLNPNRRACGSCHDDVNFATGENHADLPQISDNECSRCHTPQGELEFDLSIVGSHTVERASKELPGTIFEILDVTEAAPGRRPTVTFSIANDQGASVEPGDMGRLALVLAGNIEGSADFGQFYSENATGAQGSAGRYFYTFERAIPEAAVGTWAVGVEGYQNAMILPGTNQERSVRDAGDNKVFYFSIDGAPAQPRRQVVTQEKCNACHFDLDLHGSNRNDVEHCVLCHNPNVTDVARRPTDAGAPESVNFKEMIHKIHRGEELTRELTIFGFGGTPHNYNEVRFPNRLSDCSSCHVNGSQNLPLPADVLSTVTPRDPIDPAPPATGACLSCHTRLSAAAHADLNISDRFGESCDVCHGSEAEFSVERLHAR